VSAGFAERAADAHQCPRVFQTTTPSGKEKPVRATRMTYRRLHEASEGPLLQPVRKAQANECRGGARPFSTFFLFSEPVCELGANSASGPAEHR
jgi:hypothetical protein